MYKLLFFLIFIFSFFTAKSQHLIFPGTNVSVKNESKHFHEKDSRASDTLKIPFFDDFSRPMVYPNPNIWQDNYVFINQTLAINPPSIGVATFDAINFDGSINEFPNTYGFVSDYLTSKPINLNYPSDTTIYLSFMYQPQGIGDAPETGDSLILEFYSPTNSAWYNIWSEKGESNHDFKTVIIKISDSKFLTSGFQFRFKNKASFSSNADYAGRRSNCDYWNIDWIYLNKNRNKNDININDVALTKPLKSLLFEYESVPWTHLFNDTTIFKPTFFNTSIQNHFINENKNVSLSHKISNLKPPYDSQIYYAGVIPDLKADTIIVHTDSININPFLLNYQELAKYKITSYLEDNSAVDTILGIKLRTNDTLTYIQDFNNYYAYDDGSAEAGFGMDGNQTEGAKGAVLFKSHKKDTLRAINIYFNQTYKNALEKIKFYLTIWEYNNGKPGDTIYKSEAILPIYEDSFNKFHTYNLDSTKYPVIDGKFFVGWEQIETEFLNIGFDMNNDASSKFLYNIFGTWQTFPTSGALMIRPIFRNASVLSNVEEVVSENDINLFPNPTSNKINIRSNENIKITEIEIFDISGRKLKSSFETENIDVSDFSKGIYFVKIHNSTNRTIVKKFVVE